MDLSVVVVNYNVKHFLEQCLKSVEIAAKGLNTEVFVVDNNSVDGSQAMVKKLFPWVKLIESKENLGFSRGNNLAIRQASGKYVLLLNPDTVVQEDTFKLCFDHCEADPSIGGLGVKMIDGSGKYLPESKRGLPAPWTAFYKMVGLCSLFPKSQRFARYYMGHLSKDENHPIEVLSGAYMWMRKESLDKIGLLDESFFMYGEDIDLSFRILKGGYKNFYLANTKIIHYKGESTKKGSLNYVRVFYQAMILYAQKHFKGQHARLFIGLIKLAVYFKAIFALIKNAFSALWKPLIEFALLLILLSFYLTQYSGYSEKVFPELVNQWAPSVIGALVVFNFLIVGSYKRSGGYAKLVKGVAFSVLSLGFIYSLLPETMRFSRLFVLSSPLVGFLPILILRSLTDRFGVTQYFKPWKTVTLVVGDKENTESFIQKLPKDSQYDRCLSWNPNLEEKSLKTLELELAEWVKINRIDEVIFLNSDIKNETIITLMSMELPRTVHFKIVPREADFVIGSGSKDHRGELQYIEPEPLFSRSARLKKRLVDYAISLNVLVLLPYLVFRNNPLKLAVNLFLVIRGKYTWIGLNEEFTTNLIHQKSFKGIIPVANPALEKEQILLLNRNYCKNYQLNTDFNLFWQNLAQLDSAIET
ncbi:glycosyltransferase family 2 protein [Luteibaculum oceani]|uniref:Glycosyltransferase n=1 Tax=Luteibaculum oceani TaxID=1294296 RepID=A0A5C6VB15_9FLAO|nr:glycosyltransferase [Luteibaculum oceani]TXC82064.1 glycosyltransferase [Luteibaculum oceani]